MASSTLLTRLRYLNDSAHLLVTTAPTTSAHLMSRCHNLMFENELDQTEVHKREACGACGNIMVLGWTAKREIQDVTIRKKRPNGRSVTERPATDRAKVVVYNCGLCGRQTRQNIATAVPRSARTQIAQFGRREPGTATDISTPSSNGQPLSQKSGSASANASSRRRAKVRKQSGLQALLAKSKEAETRGVTGGFGLDLLDMMRKA